MSESIEDVLWYSIGAFDYLKNSDYNTINLQSGNTIIDQSIQSEIDSAIKSLNLTPTEIDSKKKIIESMCKKRRKFPIKSNVDREKLDFISNLYFNYGFKGFDDYISNLEFLIDNNKLDENIILSENLKTLSSFQYLELLGNMEQKDLLKYYSKVFSLFTKIIDFDINLFDAVDSEKQPFYFLIQKTLLNLYQDKKNSNIIIIYLKTFEILDLFIIFETSSNLFPTKMVEYIQEQLILSAKTENWPPNRYNLLNMFLLEILNPLHEDFLILWKNYYGMDINVAYLKMAIFALYNSNVDTFERLMDKIDPNEYDSIDLEKYYELIDIRENFESRELINYKIKDEILSLIAKNDREELTTFLATKIDDNYLNKFCLDQVITSLLDAKNFSVIECEFILYAAPMSLIVYLARSSSYIKDEDISLLFIYSVLLLSLNLFDEALMLSTKILEKVLTLNKVNDSVIANLELQIKILKLFLAYNY